MPRQGEDIEARPLTLKHLVAAAFIMGGLGGPLCTLVAYSYSLSTRVTLLEAERTFQQERNSRIDNSLKDISSKVDVLLGRPK